MKFIKLILILSILLTASCVQSDGEAPTTLTTGTTATTTTKAMLSSWATSNAAWALRLDLNSANLNGTSFTLIVKFSDSSETWCTAALNGNELNGTYTVSSCVGHGGMSASVTTSLETGGTGSYSNSGTVLSVCKANTACFDYY